MILSPSIMCADLSKLGAEVEALDAAGADVFHLDIMDGVFVPNFALSWGDVAAVRKMTRKKIDVHLMVQDPVLHLPYAFRNQVDIIYVHFESGRSADLLREIRRNGAEAGLVISPTTEIAEVRHLLAEVDRVLVMRVHPGFAGQKAVLGSDDKLEKLIAMKDGFKIGIDGAVSAGVVHEWKECGVDEFILGTSSLFRKGLPYRALMNEMRRDVGQLIAAE